MAKHLILVNERERPPSDSYKNYNGFAFFYSRQSRRLCVRHDDRRIQVSIGFSPAAVKIRLRDISERTGGGAYQRRGDAVSIIPSGQPYTTEWLACADLVNIYLEPSFIVRAAYESARGRVIDIKGRYLVRDRFIEMLGASLRSELKIGTPNLLYAESAATVLAVHLVRKYATVSSTPREITGKLSPYCLRKATDYIEAHLGANIRLSEMAAQLRMSPHYFSALFKNSTGFTPHRYVTNRRIERAMQMLAGSDLKLAEIAAALGFATHSRFTEVFAHRVGTTPREYRNSL